MADQPTACDVRSSDSAPCCACERGQLLLLAGLILLQFVPIWAFEYFPSTDGPAHLANAAILKDYRAPDVAAWREFYTIPGRLDPNLAGHLILVGLMFVAPPLIAEKILLTLFVIALPLAFRYALRGLRRDAGWAAFLILPFTYSYALHMGFYNFSLGLAGYLVVVGYWARGREQFTIARGLALAGLLLGLYVFHLVALLLALATIGLMTLWTLVVGPDRFTWPSIRSRIIIPACAALPATALAMLFLKRHHDPKVVVTPTLKLLLQLLRLDTLGSFHDWEVFITAGFSAIVFLACIWAIIGRLRRRGIEWQDGMVLVALAVLGLYLKAGEQAFLPVRLAMFVYMAILLWLGVQRMAPTLQRILQAAGGAAAVAMLIAFLPTYAVFNDQLRDYVALARQVEPGSTLLPVTAFRLRYGWAAGGQANQHISTFMYASGYVVPQRRIVDLRNYEAQMGYFPVDYRAEVNPYVHLTPPTPDPRKRWIQLEDWPLKIDLAAYEARTGRRIDYVLVWSEPRDLADPVGQTLLKQIDDGYTLVAISPGGLGKLYKRKAAIALARVTDAAALIATLQGGCERR